MASYTTDTLIESVRRRGHLTHSAGSIDLDDLVFLANEELQTYVVQFLIQLRAEFNVSDHPIALTAGTSLYDLPSRAVGSEVRQVLRETTENQFERILRVEPERILVPPQANSGPTHYYFKDLQIGFTPCGGSNVIVQYFRRPGDLVLEVQGAQVTAIDEMAGTVTLAAVPDTFTDAAEYDFTQARPPFRLLAMDQSATFVSNVMTLAEIPTGLAVGDWVTLAQESVIPQIPLVLHPFLAQRTVVKALEALGDARGEQFAKAALDEEGRLSRILVDRTQGSPRYIINRHGPGFRKFGRRF